MRAPSFQPRPRYSSEEIDRMLAAILPAPEALTSRVAAFMARHSDDLQRVEARVVQETGPYRAGTTTLITELLRQGCPSAVDALAAHGDWTLRQRAERIRASVGKAPWRLFTGRAPSLDASELALAALLAGRTIGPESRRDLLPLLSSDDALARRLAAAALPADDCDVQEALLHFIRDVRLTPSTELLGVASMLPHRDAVAYLAAVAERHDQFRAEALRSLTANRDPSGFDALVQMTLSGHERSDALRALASRADAAARLAPLYRSDRTARTHHARLLSEVYGDGAIPLLASALCDGSRAVRDASWTALERHGAAAAPVLRPLLDSTSPELRNAALDLLARVDDAFTAARLVSRLAIAPASERVVLAGLLPAFSAVEVGQALRDILQGPDAELKRAALAGLRRFPASRWRALAAAALADADGDVAHQARRLVDDVIDRARDLDACERELIAACTSADAVAGLRSMIERRRIVEAERQRRVVEEEHTMRRARDAAERAREAEARISADATIAFSRAPVPAAASGRELSEPPPPSASPVITAPIGDTVWFSVTAPARVEPSTRCLLDVWAHRGQDHDVILRRAREASPGRPLTRRGAGPATVAQGAQLTVVLSIPDFAIAGAADVLMWTGETASCAFEVAVPREASPGFHPGRAEIHLGVLKIMTVRFELEVAAARPLVTDVTDTVSWVKTAFASYASEDRAAVLARIQGMLKLLPQLDIFMDVVSLRSGDRWQERLREEIVARELFYLFWSKAASSSPWVAAEWRLALDAHGLECISPVPMVSPALVPPPPELASLHFNDWTLALS